MNIPGIAPPEPALLYVKNFKIRMMNRLLSEQIDALSHFDKLSPTELDNYRARKSRIFKLEQELGVAPLDERQN